MASFIPLYKGTYSLSITLINISISGSPFTITVLPGAIDPTNCTSTLSSSNTISAGKTLFFTITAYDLYKNLITTGGEKYISIYAKYLNSDNYASPIGISDI